MRNNYLLLILFLLSISLISCNEKDVICDDTEPCPKEIICTEIFVTVGVEITFNGEPVKLDDFSSTIVSQNTSFDFGEYLNPAGGFHAILTDAELDLIEREGSPIRFRGSFEFNDQVYSIDELYLIGHDCCHIEILEGPTEIELNP